MNLQMEIKKEDLPEVNKLKKELKETTLSKLVLKLIKTHRILLFELNFYKKEYRRLTNVTT